MFFSLSSIFFISFMAAKTNRSQNDHLHFSTFQFTSNYFFSSIFFIGFMAAESSPSDRNTKTVLFDHTYISTKSVNHISYIYFDIYITYVCNPISRSYFSIAYLYYISHQSYGPIFLNCLFNFSSRLYIHKCILRLYFSSGLWQLKASHQGDRA